jgi:hypothetical protein
MTVWIILAALMGVRRGYHFTPFEYLPSASWAVLFLAGVYLRSFWVFAAFLVEAALLDYAAIARGGVNDFCISPAYGFLLPAYGSLWLAGRWYADRHRETAATLLPLTASLLVGAAVCELISSGSFYVFSGRFEELSLAQFVTKFMMYFPPFLLSIAFYVGVAAVLHVATRVSSVGSTGLRTSS